MEGQPLAIEVLAVPELVDLVQVYLTSNSDLVSLTQVSKSFARLFNPLLWQTIEIRTERQHRKFVNTPQVQDAIRRHGGNWIRVIRIRTPKSLTPFVQANVPLLQLHTLEFPWPRRLIFEDMAMRATDLQPFEEELDMLNEPYPDHFFLERESFHRTRAEPALSMALEAMDDLQPAAQTPRLWFWLQQRRKGIWRLELDILHLSLRMIQSEVLFRQAVEDMFHLQQSQEALSESTRLIYPLFAQATSGDLAGAISTLETDQDIEDIFFRQAMILPELVSKLRRGVKWWEKLMPEEESLLLLIEDQIKRIDRFLVDDGRELCKSVAIVWGKAKLRCQKHVGDMESLQRKLQVQGHQPHPASATIQRLQERVERNLRLLQHDVQQQRQNHLQQQIELLLSREKALKSRDSDLQLWLVGFNHIRQRPLYLSSVQRSLRDRRPSDPKLLFQESCSNRSPSLTLSGKLLDRMQASVAEQLVRLSNFEPENDVGPSLSSTKLDPFSMPLLLSEWPFYPDLWDYFDPVKEVDQWLVPFLAQACPNLRSFGCIYFPFASVSLLQALSCPPLSHSLRVLSMVNADPELNVNVSELLHQLVDLPPQLKSFRFGAELALNSVPTSAEGEMVTLLSRFSLQGSPTLGLKMVMIEGSLRDFDSTIWTGILRRCSSLETLGLKSYYSSPLLKDLAVLFSTEGSCLLLRELCLSGGNVAQDGELANFLEACRKGGGDDEDDDDGGGRGNSNNGSTVLNSRRRGVTRVQLIEADHFGEESYKVLLRFYRKTLTHLSIHDCHGPLSLKYRPSSPMLSDLASDGADAVHPILRILALFESLQGLETFPVQCLDPYPTQETSSGTFLDAYHLVQQYDWMSDKTAKSTVTAASVPVAFRPWRCFSTLRVLQVVIGGNHLEITGRGSNEERFDRDDRVIVARDCRKICKMLGTLTALEELYLGSDHPEDISALYQAAHDEVFEGALPKSSDSELFATSSPQTTPTGSTSASTPPKLRATPSLVKETAIFYGQQIERRHRQDIQSNCLLMTLESGLDEMADLKALRVLDLGCMDHEIGIPELQWIVEHWPSLKSAPGLAREDWSDELDDWLKTNAPHLRHD